MSSRDSTKVEGGRGSSSLGASEAKGTAAVDARLVVASSVGASLETRLVAGLEASLKVSHEASLVKVSASTT